LAGSPETAVGLDDPFDPDGHVVEHRVEVDRLADPGKARLADAGEVGDYRLRTRPKLP
jgi:hypothetical protein